MYLSDFGVSKGATSSASLTETGQFLGTPDYSAPEQIQGGAVDGRADQYALACVAYQLLTGVVPFVRDQGMAVLLAHLSEPPPSLGSRRPGLPVAADEVLARGMAKVSEKRYGSCGDFAAALREALGLAPYYPPGTASTADHPPTQIVSPPPRLPGTRREDTTSAPPRPCHPAPIGDHCRHRHRHRRHRPGRRGHHHLRHAPWPCRAALLRHAPGKSVAVYAQDRHGGAFDVNATQTVEITGSCFGAGNTTSAADTPYFRISDLTAGWNACWTGDPNDVTCDISSWTDNEITFSGYTSYYGQYGWVVTDGQAIEVQVWNPQDGKGPATCQVVAGSGSTSNCPGSAANVASMGDDGEHKPFRLFKVFAFTAMPAVTASVIVTGSPIASYYHHASTGPGGEFTRIEPRAPEAPPRTFHLILGPPSYCSGLLRPGVRAGGHPGCGYDFTVGY